jgi:photosystem II stability/assembly factor-like uncharacterized protein
MVSPKDGWAATLHHGIARTTDGARSWEFASPLPGFDNERVCGSGAGDIFATGPNRAWYAFTCGTAPGITVWRTSDAGRTWRAAVLTGFGTYIGGGSIWLQFVSATTGWLAPEGASMNGLDGAESLFETRDSGGHWTEISRAGTPAAQLGFVSRTRGYAADWALGYASPGFAHFPLVTNNGGRDWYHPQVPVPTGYAKALIQVYGIGATGADSVSIPVTPFFPDPVGGFLFTTYRSDDGGVHWWHTSVLPGGTAGDYFTGFFINAHDGFAGDRQSGSYHTTDGGEHWSKLPKSWDPAGQFVTTRVAFALDGEVIREATNAGETWISFFPRLTRR